MTDSVNVVPIRVLDAKVVAALDTLLDELAIKSMQAETRKDYAQAERLRLVHRQIVRLVTAVL
jgi:hypothetical protein